MHDKRAEKIKNHFEVIINGEKFKVVNIISREDKVRLLTKVRGQSFPKGEIVTLEVETEAGTDVLLARWKYAAVSPVLEDHTYEIMEKMDHR